MTSDPLPGGHPARIAATDAEAPGGRPRSHRGSRPPGRRSPSRWRPRLRARRAARSSPGPDAPTTAGSRWSSVTVAAGFLVAALLAALAGGLGARRPVAVAAAPPGARRRRVHGDRRRHAVLRRGARGGRAGAVAPAQGGGRVRGRGRGARRGAGHRARRGLGVGACRRRLDLPDRDPLARARGPGVRPDRDSWSGARSSRSATRWRWSTWPWAACSACSSSRAGHRSSSGGGSCGPRTPGRTSSGSCRWSSSRRCSTSCRPSWAGGSSRAGAPRWPCWGSRSGRRSSSWACSWVPGWLPVGERRS